MNVDELFAEFAGKTHDEIAAIFIQRGYKMPAPFTHSDVVRTNVVSQWIEKKTGRTVRAGTTSFTFDNEEGMLYYPPDNVCRFAAGAFTGKYKELYLPKEKKDEPGKHQQRPDNLPKVETSPEESERVGTDTDQTSELVESERA